MFGAARFSRIFVTFTEMEISGREEVFGSDTADNAEERWAGARPAAVSVAKNQ